MGLTCETVVIFVAGPHQIADLRVRYAGDAVDGRIDLGPGQVQLGILQAGLLGEHLCLERGLIGEVGIELLLRDGVLRRQGSVTIDVRGRLGELRLRHRHLRLGLFHRSLDTAGGRARTEADPS